MKKLTSISLTGLHLKLIGWFFTLFYLAALMLFPAEDTGMAKMILTYIGYISLPFFAFLLVEGFAYTRSRIRYSLFLLGAALLAEPFYDFFCCGAWLDFEAVNGQNILFAYFLGVVQLYFISYMGTGTIVRTVCTVVMVLACGIWAVIFNIPGGGCVQLLVGIFYLLHEHPRVKNWLAAAAALLCLTTPVLAVPVITWYNDDPGDYNKYLFYVAYPAIWMVAVLVKFWLV